MTFLDVAPKLTEKQFMGQIIRAAQLFGWRHYHSYDSRRSAAGFPDLVLVRARHSQPRVLFIEVKADRTPVTDDQRAWIADLRACGQEAYVFRPRDWQTIERVLRSGANDG